MWNGKIRTAQSIEVWRRIQGNGCKVEQSARGAYPGRVNLDKICGVTNPLCATNPDGTLALDSQGRVESIGGPVKIGETVVDVKNLKQLFELYPEWRSPMGGWQGSLGEFTAFDYSPGSFWDRVSESYAGTHDTFNSPTWYDDMGNIKRGMSEGMQRIGDITNYLNVVLATPFALSSMLPPGVYAAMREQIKKQDEKDHSP